MVGTITVTRTGTLGKTSSGRSRGRGGTRAEQIRADEISAAEETRRVEEQLKIDRIEQLRVQEQSRIKLQTRIDLQNKIQTLKDSREERIQKLADENIQSGISSGGTARANAENVIKIRDQVAIRDLEKEFKAGQGATGTVTIPSTKPIVSQITPMFRSSRGEQPQTPITNINQISKRDDEVVAGAGTASIGESVLNLPLVTDIKEILNNQRNVNFARLNSVASVFSDPERFRIGLSEEEKDMRTRDVIFGRFEEVGAGFVKAGGGIGEFAINTFSLFGTQTIQPDQKFGLFGVKDQPKFEFGGKIGEIMNRPETTGTLLGQSLVILPLFGGGASSIITGIKNTGFATSFKEIAVTFSPFRIQPGTFGTLESTKAIKDLKFDVVSIKSQKGDITTRNIFGTTGDVFGAKVTAIQISKNVAGKEVGGSIANLYAPRTTISRTGRVTEGLRVLRIESIFKGEVGEVFVNTKDLRLNLQGITGGRADVFSRTTLDLVSNGKNTQVFFNPKGKFDSSKIAGISKKGDQFDIFGSGKAKDVLRIGRTGGQQTSRVGRFDIRGREISKKKGITFEVVGVGKVPTITQQVTLPPILTLPKSTLTKTPSTILNPTLALISSSSPSLSLGTIKPKQNTITNSGQLTNLITKTKPLTDLKNLNIPKIDVFTRSGSRSVSTNLFGERTKQEPSQKPLTIQTPKTLTKQKTDQKILTRLRQLQQQRQKTRINVPPFVSFIINPKPKKGKGIGIGFLLRSVKKKKKKGGLFIAEVRRGGIFRTVAVTKDLNKALNVGRGIVERTLAASFRIIGAKGVGTPLGFRRRGDIFIEKRGRRLKKRKTGSKETQEIQRAKLIKKKRRKKKNDK